MSQETTPPTSPVPGEDPRWREAAERAALAIYREGLAGGDPSASVILDAFADLRAKLAALEAENAKLREALRWRDAKVEPPRERPSHWMPLPPAPEPTGDTRP